MRREAARGVIISIIIIIIIIDDPRVVVVVVVVIIIVIIIGADSPGLFSCELFDRCECEFHSYLIKNDFIFGFFHQY